MNLEQKFFELIRESIALLLWSILLFGAFLIWGSKIILFISLCLLCGAMYDFSIYCITKKILKNNTKEEE